MLLSNTLTTETKGYYHYHLLGCGVIANYHILARQLIYTCERTGAITDVIQLWDMPFNNIEQFTETMKQTYVFYIENGVDFGRMLVGVEHENLN